MKLFTPRLELVSATLEMVTADLHQRERLEALLRARIGDGWPPPLVNVEAMRRMKNALVQDPALGGWTTWYWITRRPRVLIGLSGFKTKPVRGQVEIGYTVLSAWQRRGYATEVVRAMIDWAFANGVHRVIAETLPELVASQRVLEKCCFKLRGQGSEAGVLRYECRRGRIERCG
jgi:RimJ/RimL family protein N-acetyltransferase